MTEQTTSRAEQAEATAHPPQGRTTPQWRRGRYYIARLDCPCEERLIRMATEGLEGLRLEFDLEQRELTAYYQEKDAADFAGRLERLALGTQLIEETAAAPPEASDTKGERRTLIIVLIINLALFAIEGLWGLLSGSMGLVGDSLDMLADTFVYGLSLYAVGRSLRAKKNVATTSGYIQILLAVLGIYEVIMRFVFGEAPPDFWAMIYISLLALAGNATCLYLLQRTRGDEAHIRASIIFSANDVLINLGVIVSAVFVAWLGSPYPDLIIGSVIFALVLSGAVRILRLGRG